MFDECLAYFALLSISVLSTLIESTKLPRISQSQQFPRISEGLNSVGMYEL